MIRQQTVTSIYSLAQVADRAKVVILPFGNTPLAALNSAIGKFKTDSDVVVAQLHDVSSQKDLLGAADHSDAIDQMVDIASNAVRSQLKHARELVRPFATDAFEKVNTYLDSVPAEMLRNSIIEIDLPALYNEAGIQDMVDRYKTQPQMELPTDGSVFPELSGEDLVERCKTGLSRIDKELTVLIEGSPDILTRVYDKYFRNTQNPIGHMDATGSHQAESIVAFVLARNLNGSVPEGVKIELSVYRSVTAHFTAEFGRRIFQVLRRRDRISRQNDMIVRMPRAQEVGGEIQVNGDVYRKFLKEGGTPEALIGACLRGIERPLYADLLEDAYGGEKAVKSNERLLQNRLIVEQEANVVLAILDTFNTLIKINGFPEGVDVPNIRDVKDWLKDNPYRKKFDLDDYVLRATCEALFPRYNAYPVLSGMMDYMAIGDKMTSREAASMVAMDLVGEWLSAQLTTEPMKGEDNQATYAALGNAVELGSRVVHEVVGNEASTVVGGVQVIDIVRDSLTARLSKSLMII
jgi:hypothetical protein